ncbi:MAG: glycerol kinase GlpK [Dehalococcoidia bacterium]|nr:glycerol kinase GlpK [Dehalococcoidia bacterium]
MPRYLLALDEGTTSARALLFDERARVVAVEQREVAARYPQPGWVEQDPREIWDTQLRVARGVLERAGIAAGDVAAIGITNQRETAVVWDRATGEPVYPAIVWQSRQTAAICDDLKARGLEDAVRARTGLVIDPYFSATKVRFILDAVEGAQARAERGELAFGTVDSWLLYRLTGGREHVTDVTNASRTMLYNIHARDWDDTLLKALRIPRAMLPGVRASSGRFGTAEAEWLGAPVPVLGVAGDQQSALFGQRCFVVGTAKNTYGTGCFLLEHTGERARASANGLLTTIAASHLEPSGGAEYALEGAVFSAGAAVQWLRDELRIIDSAAESAEVARSVPDTGGVYLVPAFTGLGAPHWDDRARGLLVGLTRGTGRPQIVRAALEAIAYQVRDLVECLRADSAADSDTDSGVAMESLSADGGGAANDFLMQFQADILGIPVRRPHEVEVTALGAAALAGIAAGTWRDRDEFASAAAGDEVTFEPSMSPEEREAGYAGWQRAVERSLGWSE